jgi:uncharacterized protein (DUF1810 family)
MEDRFNLKRFVEAQRDEIETARAELIRGRKYGHWIWFVFPQLRGLGQSWMANHYGISCREEAETYLKHPTLGPRLIELTEVVNQIEGHSITEIFGALDSVKFRSSMTLFAAADPGVDAFVAALAKYFEGPDQLTIDFLKKSDLRSTE